MELFIFHDAAFSLSSPISLSMFMGRVDPEVQRKTKKTVCCPEPAVAQLTQKSSFR